MNTRNGVNATMKFEISPKLPNYEQFNDLSEKYYGKKKQRMKIRLAKKIMACDFRKVVRRDLPWDKELKELDILCKKSHYWYLRHYAYRPLKRIQERRKKGWGKELCRDHRIAKAISLTK